MKVRSNTPPDCCVCPQRIVSDCFSPFCCQLFAECLSDYSFYCHNTHLVVTVRIILRDHTWITCGSIRVCILSQRIRVKSVRSVVLDCFRRSNGFDNLCAGSAKSCTDQAFFQSNLIHQIIPSFVCNVVYTLQVCQGHSVICTKSYRRRISVCLDIAVVISHSADHFVLSCQIFVCFRPGSFPVISAEISNCVFHPVVQICILELIFHWCTI